MNPFLIWLAASAATLPAEPAPAPASSAALASTSWTAPVAAATQASYLLTPFEYTYIDAVYQSIDQGNGAPTQDGFGLYGSFDITDNIRLLANFGEASGEDSGGKQTVRDFGLGFGFHGSYNDYVDVIGNFQWVQRQFSGAVTGKHKGWIAGVGVRALPLEQIELDAQLLFQNSADEDLGGELGGVWHFHEYVGLRIAGMALGDETRYWGGLRFSL